MAEATLTYFDIRGRAELARLVLEHSGTKYNDKRVTFEEWPEVSICRDHRTFCNASRTSTRVLGPACARPSPV